MTMAGRSLLGCLSRSLRRGQQALRRISSDPPPPFERFLPQFGDSSDRSNDIRYYGSSDSRGSRDRYFAKAPRSILVPSSSSSLAIASEAGCGSSLSLDKRGFYPSVPKLGQIVSYSSSAALAIEEDETERLAVEIGYRVSGQYVPEGGQRIKPQAAFAVVQVGSHQFKVTPGDMIYTEKLKYADINEKICLNKVLLMGTMDQTMIGRPTVPEGSVLAVVEEIALDAKVIVFKKKRRKNYRRTNGHRQELTRLRILHIDGIATPASLSDNATSQLDNVPVAETSV